MKGQDLKVIRKRAGLTQRQLAVRLGYPDSRASRVNIGRYETGARVIPPRLRILIERTFDSS